MSKWAATDAGAEAATGASPDTPVPGPRVGVLVVAYNAETTLAQTLARLPRSFTLKADHLLIADDASQDETYEIGMRFRAGSQLPMTVVSRESQPGLRRQPEGGISPGHRGRHGHHRPPARDGQYAPEVIGLDLTAPIEAGEADAVFGSRMMQRGAALSGGMPLYKYLGNKVLTRFENAVLGTDLSEFHSGYRAYSTDTLRMSTSRRTATVSTSTPRSSSASSTPSGVSPRCRSRPTTATRSAG